MTDQEKRKKVIKGLECCMSGQPDGLGCSRVPCPYNQFEDCEGILHRDALALLKAQEAVEPIPTTDDDWTCGHCGMSLVGYEELDVGGFTTVRHNFCPKCGRAVKWK